MGFGPGRQSMCALVLVLPSIADEGPHATYETTDPAKKPYTVFYSEKMLSVLHWISVYATMRMFKLGAFCRQKCTWGLLIHPN